MRRILLACALAALGLAVSSPRASAHALLRDSNPADGALLQEAPGEILLDFTEEPDLSLSRFEVLDTSGRGVQGGAPEKVPGERRTIRVPLDEIPDGVYTVSWRVLSTVDGHVTSGAFAFGIGVSEIAGAARPATPEVASPRPTALAVAGRWGFYWSVALLLAAAALALVVLGPAWRPPQPLLIGAWALGAAGVVALLLAESRAAQVGVGQLLGSERGRVILFRGAGLALAGVAVLLALVRRRPWTAVTLGAVTAGVMLIQAYAGHAGGATSLRWAKVGVQWVHLLAVGLWVGGLVWLLAGTWRRDAAEVGRAVGRFSTLAGMALAGVAVTGGLRAIDELGGFGNLTDTGFGLAVVAKVVLFFPLVALGAFNRYRTVPALRRGEERVGLLRRAVAGEVTLAIGIFGVTGVMAGLAPPQYTADRAGPRPEAVVVSASDFATTVRVRLTAAPGTAGPNRLSVRIADYDTGEPVEASRVRLRFSLPDRADIGRSELVLEESSPGLWEAPGANLSVEGRWRVGVLIEQAADSVEVPLEVQTRLPRQDITVSEAPGQPTLYTIALPGGLSVQGYVDPGAPGPNELHFTFFSPDGGEQPIASPRISASLTSETPEELEARELSPGHFVAPVELAAGRWRFRVEAATPEGMVLSAYFEQAIERE